MKENEKRYVKACQKWIARGSLIAGFFWVLFFSYYAIDESIPDKIRIQEGEAGNFNFHVPITGEMEIEEEGLEVFGNQSPVVDKDKVNLNMNENFSLKSAQQGSYSITCKLFGLIQVKEVEVEVVEQKQIAPCGEPVGIYVKTDGVMIIGTGAISGSDGMNYEPAENLVKSGDYVKTVNEQVVETKEDLIEKINQSKGEPVILGIMRDDEYIRLKMQPIKTEEDQYKLGIWVRDDLAGVGTLTFYDESGNFGALGHPVSDMDTGMKVNMAEGTLYETEVSGITKGEKGNPGEIAGLITYQDSFRLGSVQKNTDAGIYGTLEKVPEEVDNVYYPIAFKQDIKEGDAAIISTVSGERKEYAITITGMDYNSENKGIVFQVTDQELLDLTGGIIQGMSGSPIVQDGKVIGAVTHVFVQDATKGYGIFIENMLEH